MPNKGEESMQMTQTGKPFPRRAPSKKGIFFELDLNGTPVLVINLHSSPVELAALKAGFTQYSLFEDFSLSNLGCLVLHYPAPVGYQSCPFHVGVGLHTDGSAEKFLQNWGNQLISIILQGQTVKAMYLSRLSYQAAEVLKGIVSRQFSTPIKPDAYIMSVSQLHTLSADEIFRRGIHYSY
jgi:hypothetical protein